MKKNRMDAFSGTGWLLLFICVLFATGSLLGGTTGKISGKATDALTKETIIGASVMIGGTSMGAATDVDGYYYINNIPPGTYSVIVSILGYEKLTFQNVVVKIDLTTSLDAKLNATTVIGKEVIVQAERPLVQKDLTSSSVTVSSEDIKLMPVENIHQVIGLQAGVVGGHFRGGRSGEVAYLIDGVAVNNPATGGSGFTPENASVREMEVISGTFNAEYGQAMSGVVNIVTNDGAKEFHGSVGAYIGDFYTKHSDVFVNLDKLNLLRTKNFQFSLSGPTYVDDQLTFFVTGRYLDEDGYLYGKRVYKTTDDAPIFPDPIDRTRWVAQNTGDGEFVPMNPFRKYSLNAKLSYTYEGLKFSYSIFWDSTRSKGYDHSFKWTPDGITTHYGQNMIHNFQINHAMSQSTFHSLKFSVNRYRAKGYTYEDPFSPLYVDPNRGTPPSDYTFRSGGNHTGRYISNTQSVIGQYSISSQVSREHKIGAGVEVRMHQILNHGTSVDNMTKNLYDSLGTPIFTVGYPNLGTIGNQMYDKRPIEASGYIQDKMEYGSMIINAGLRFDYFNPQAKLLTDLRNPTRNANFNAAQVGKKKWATEKFQLSPRLGVSFPITDQGIIHFSYGHFFQIPTFENLYVNSDYLVLPQASLSSTMGNPDLKAQQTVMYELGLQQEFFGTIGLDFTVYYRDIRNLLGMEIINTYEGFKYARYINRDYGNVRGFILSVDRRFMNYFSARADYTYQIAEGNASDPLQVFYDNQTDPPIESTKKVLPLNWDQRSTLNLSLNVGEQGNWTAGAIVRYGSGFPYTEDIRVSQGIRFENGGVKPTTYEVDLRLEKTIKIESTSLNLFVLIYNVFDTMNENNVNSASGRANVDIFTYQSGAIIGLNTLQEYLNNPTSFSAPRQIRAGFNFGF